MRYSNWSSSSRTQISPEHASFEPPAGENFDEKVLTPMRSKRPPSPPRRTIRNVDFSDLTKPDASSPRASQKIDISKSHVPMPGNSSCHSSGAS